MNRLPTSKRVQILHLLVEGNSLRSTSRIADVSINTVTKLLIDAGKACDLYQDTNLINLPCQRIQVDEIWSFCYAKQKNVPHIKSKDKTAGDLWTWTAICSDTKIVPSWYIGNRGKASANNFIKDLSKRMKGKIQITSDGHKPYMEAIEYYFGSDIDYGMLVKIYDKESKEKRYSPSKYVKSVKNTISGNPNKNYISTSIVERNNLNMRMSMRRFTRLTNGFSKKVENHAHAVSLHFMHYNFARIHKSLRITPAMAAGVSNHVWELEEIIDLID